MICDSALYGEKIVLSDHSTINAWSKLYSVMHKNYTLLHDGYVSHPEIRKTVTFKPGRQLQYVLHAKGIKS